MPAIGITGGISTGKSTFCRELRQILPEASFFDADKAARSLTDVDVDIQRQVKALFGEAVYSHAGDLNRAKVRAIISVDAAKRRALEQILHPRIRSQWSAEAQRYCNSSDYFFADIPLLYETGGERLCDRVVVIACSPEVQLHRLLERRSAVEPVLAAGGSAQMSENEAVELIKAQMPLDEKIRLADHVVWNNDGQELLARQANILVDLWRTTTWTRK